MQLAEALKHSAGEDTLVAGLVSNFVLDCRKTSQQGMGDKHYPNAEPDWFSLALSAICEPASQSHKAIYMSCPVHGLLSHT